MIYLLLALSAVGFGWFARESAYLIVRRVLEYQQTLRLKNLMGTRHKALPFQTFLSFMEGNLKRLSRRGFIKDYFEFISKYLKRMDRADLTASYIFGYQIMISVSAASVFYLLADSAFLALIAFVLGASLPLFWLKDKALRREKAILRELPNSLEVLSLCSEAGLSLEQAMDQYLKNAKPGALKDELGAILEQTRSGSNRKDALAAAALKLELTDFSLFTTSLIQAEKFGTGVAKTLRQLSVTMRDKQSQRAEKAVQEMPVKMLLPLVLFIMPVTFLIIFGPILLQFLRP
jgi:pilus assembly protein TadC